MKIQILKILTEKYGFSLAFACGALANFEKESALNPCNLQNTYNKRLNLTDEEYVEKVDSGEITRTQFKSHSHGGFGLCQWTYHTRKASLYDFAKSQSKSIGDLEMQIAFFVKEMKESYKKLYKELMALPDNADGAYSAGYSICYKYEAPAKKETSSVSRGKLAKEYFEKYGIPTRVSVEVKNIIEAEKLEEQLKELGYNAIRG